jgi:hypothetical protein
MIGAVLAAALVIGPAAADELAAAAMTPDPLTSALVGPSGQVWIGDGHGTWIRDHAGGTSADVRGATFASRLIVVGRATPPYRFEASGWQPIRLGERGKTTVGRGPRASLTVGNQIFVWNVDRWLRVGSVTGPITGLWAASEKKVFVGTGAALWRLAGKRFVEQTQLAVAGFADGGHPWAFTADGRLYDVVGKQSTTIATGGEVIAPDHVTVAGNGELWATGHRAGSLVLVHRISGAWQEVPGPTVAADDVVVGLGVGAADTVVMPMHGGTIWLSAGGTWSEAPRVDRIPAAIPGPGPATMP